MTIDAFGIPKTQSRVYQTLVSIGPSTGYAIARRSGIARANVYDALDLLVAKGFATSTGGRPVRFTAADPSTVADIISRDFGKSIERLSLDLGVQGFDGGIVRPPSGLLVELRGRAALFEAVCGALDGAESEVLAVVGPWSQEVFDGLARCHQRRLGVRIVSLGSPAPDGAAIRMVGEAELRGYWGGLPLALVIDRGRAVCAVERGGDWIGVDTKHPGLVPFMRHLLRRELASGAGARV